MFKTVAFDNFKALRSATLPLQPFTLLVGPNGSGKSTALQAIRLAAHQHFYESDRIRSLNVSPDASTRVVINWDNGAKTYAEFARGNFARRHDNLPPGMLPGSLDQLLGNTRFYSFDPAMIARSQTLMPNAVLQPDGGHLAVVLDRLRDSDPERFENLNRDLRDWLPEFDRVLFRTPSEGQREFLLRVAGSKSGITASELSHGTVFALTLLTLSNLLDPPPFLGIEEPERGVHPRMLRRVQDALYRLCYPKKYGDARPPVQVLATTHSPFLLDLYRDYPDQIVIAEKRDGEATLTRLTDKVDVGKLLGEAGLGDLWYSGILGGVPPEA
jgi:predicted ATPase